MYFIRFFDIIIKYPPEFVTKDRRILAIERANKRKTMKMQMNKRTNDYCSPKILTNSGDGIFFDTKDIISNEKIRIILDLKNHEDPYSED